MTKIYPTPSGKCIFHLCQQRSTSWRCWWRWQTIVIGCCGHLGWESTNTGFAKTRLIESKIKLIGVNPIKRLHCYSLMEVFLSQLSRIIFLNAYYCHLVHFTDEMQWFPKTGPQGNCGAQICMNQIVITWEWDKQFLYDKSCLM